MNRNTKKGPSNLTPNNALNLVLYNVFYGLEFFDTQESLSGAKRTITCTPNITIKDNEIYFDYRSCNDEDYQYIKTIFKGIAKNSVFTVSDALYRDELLGVDDINLSAVYTVVEFFEDKRIVKGALPATLTYSDRLNNYKKENFIYTPQIEVASLANKTSKFGMINYLGSNSLNSFTEISLESDEHIEFSGTASNNKLFTIDSFYTDNEGREILIFKENCIAENALDIPVIVGIYGENTQQRSVPVLPKDPTRPGIYGVTGATCSCPPVELEAPPLLPGEQDSASGPRYDWFNRELACCKCLVYAEETCNKNCQECLAWVLKNRRRDPVPGGAIPNNERTMCEQAVNSSAFEGGCNGDHSDKFRSCTCNKQVGTAPDPRNPLEGRCIDNAEAACLNAYPAVTGDTQEERDVNAEQYDPTNGANYFYACYLNGNGNGFAGAMACNIQAGICSKVTTGQCTKCATCYYKCISQPRTCSELRRRGLIPRIPSPNEMIKIHENASKVTENSNNMMSQLGLPGDTDPIVKVPDYMSFIGYDGTIESIMTPEKVPFTGPYAIAGNYPLYVTSAAAVAASPMPTKRRAGESTIGYHIIIISNIKYYMPNGLIMNKTQFHGNYRGSGGGSSSSTPPISRGSGGGSSSSTPPSSSSRNSGY